MTCAKRRVVCYIVTPTGGYARGENSCRNPQPTCPRLPGEGYEKCRTICNQRGHAEVEALTQAKEHSLLLKDATATIYGHWYACTDCSERLRDAGISRLIIEERIPEWLTRR